MSNDLCIATFSRLRRARVKLDKTDKNGSWIKMITILQVSFDISKPTHEAFYDLYLYMCVCVQSFIPLNQSKADHQFEFSQVADLVSGSRMGWKSKLAIHVGFWTYLALGGLVFYYVEMPGRNQGPSNRMQINQPLLKQVRSFHFKAGLIEKERME